MVQLAVIHLAEMPSRLVVAVCVEVGPTVLMTPVLILALAKLIIPARSFSSHFIGQEFLEPRKRPLLLIGTHIREVLREVLIL